MGSHVVALDVGSATITGAVITGSGEPEILSVDGNLTVPSSVFVSAEGALLADLSEHSSAPIEISRVTRLLGRPAEVIAGAPRHADSVIRAAITPHLSAASAAVNADIDLVVATYPSTWPDHIVTAYRHAITQAAPAAAKLVPWADAIAYQTERPHVDCPVTVLDFGDRTASVTVVGFGRTGRGAPLYTITDPCGGFTKAADTAITVISGKRGIPAPDRRDEDWWRRARTTLSASRIALTHDPEANTLLDFPAPLGAVTVRERDLNDILTAHMEAVITDLVERAPVTQRWTLPGNPAAARPIVELTGGFAHDVAVQRAARNVAGATCTVVDMPAQAAAFGAVQIGARHTGRMATGARAS